MSDVTMNWRGNTVLDKVMRAGGAANRDNAVHLAGEAAMQAPVESGDLRGSLEPGGTNGRWRDEAEGLNMTVGSDLPYAAKQHEDLTLNHNGPEVPGGKAKYLEDPLNANRETYMRHIADAIREALSG